MPRQEYERERQFEENLAAQIAQHSATLERDRAARDEEDRVWRDQFSADICAENAAQVASSGSSSNSEADIRYAIQIVQRLNEIAGVFGRGIPGLNEGLDFTTRTLEDTGVFTPTNNSNRGPTSHW